MTNETQGVAGDAKSNVAEVFRLGSPAQKFLELCAYAHRNYAITGRNPGAFVRCKTASEARQLRRKFYRYRELYVTMPEEYRALHGLKFQLNGPLLQLYVKPEYILLQKNIGVQDASPDAKQSTESSGKISLS